MQEQLRLEVGIKAQRPLAEASQDSGASDICASLEFQLSSAALGRIMDATADRHGDSVIAGDGARTLCKATFPQEIYWDIKA